MMDKDLLLQHILEGMSIDDKLYEAASKGELDKVQHYLEVWFSFIQSFTYLGSIYTTVKSGLCEILASR